MKIKRTLNWPTCAPATHLRAALVLHEATVVVDDAQIPENSVLLVERASLAPLLKWKEKNNKKEKWPNGGSHPLVGVPLLAATSSCPLIGCRALSLSYSLVDVQFRLVNKVLIVEDTSAALITCIYNNEYTNPSNVSAWRGRKTRSTHRFALINNNEI